MVLWWLEVQLCQKPTRAENIGFPFTYLSGVVHRLRKEIFSFPFNKLYFFYFKWFGFVSQPGNQALSLHDSWVWGCTATEMIPAARPRKYSWNNSFNSKVWTENIRQSSKPSITSPGILSRNIPPADFKSIKDLFLLKAPFTRELGQKFNLTAQAFWSWPQC